MTTETHDPRCLTLTDSEFNAICDCVTLRILDEGSAPSGESVPPIDNPPSGVYDGRSSSPNREKEPQVMAEITALNHLTHAIDIFAECDLQSGRHNGCTFAVNDEGTRSLVIHHEPSENGLMFYVGNPAVNPTEPIDDSGMLAMVDVDSETFSLVLRALITVFQTTGRF